MKKLLVATLAMLFALSVFSQKDKVVYKERVNGFYQDSIQTGIKNFEKNPKKMEKKLILFSKLFGSISFWNSILNLLFLIFYLLNKLFQY